MPCCPSCGVKIPLDILRVTPAPSNATPPTPKQSRLLGFVRDYQTANNGVSPSFEEMQTALGLRSKGSLHTMIKRAALRNLVTYVPRCSRSLKLVEAMPC